MMLNSEKIPTVEMIITDSILFTGISQGGRSLWAVRRSGSAIEDEKRPAKIDRNIIIKNKRVSLISYDERDAVDRLGVGEGGGVSGGISEGLGLYHTTHDLAGSGLG